MFLRISQAQLECPPFERPQQELEVACAFSGLRGPYGDEVIQVMKYIPGPCAGLPTRGHRLWY